MIRLRHKKDDSGIVELVRLQLIPLSPWQHMRDSRLRSEVTRRLRRGVTLVAARTRLSTPFAFIHLEFRASVLFIDLLAVDARHQSKHWGTELMTRAEQLGLKRGCQAAHVYVDEANTRAIRFYNRLGYYFLRPIAALRVIEMRKNLF